MLHPRQRALLLDTMRPPQGYQLDHAIGTTYSLDLKMLLNVPLAFTFEGWEDDEGITRDPQSLLHSVRSYADKMHLFCQAGQIKAPAKTHKLLSYLEDSVFEVNVPRAGGRGGVFHPKVWVLRYLPDPAYEEEEEERPVYYRLLCLSRNLTFDSAWDTCLALDGELTGRRNAIAKNHPVGEFLEALPDLAVLQGSEPLEKARKKILEMGREVRRVDFKPPPGIDSCHFHPLGIDGRYPWPFPESKYPACIVSPFLSPSLLRKFEENVSDCKVLISISETLAEVEKEAPGFLEEGDREVYVLNPDADPEVEDQPDGAHVEGEDLARLRGLHAKLFIVEDRNEASVFTGSANATSAAFERNIEFMVELRGYKSLGSVGIDNFLKEDGDGLRAFLSPYTPTEGEVTDDEKLQEELDSLLDDVRRDLSRIPIRAAVKAVSGVGEEKYSIELESTGKCPGLPGGVTAVVWPALSPRKKTALEQEGARLASFERVPLESLCSFFSFRLRAEARGQTRECSFTRNCQLVGAPDDRRERLLHLLLENSGAVLKYIYMLLGSEELAVADLVAKSAGMKSFAGPGEVFSEEFPLLELMLRRLVDSPETLGEVRQLIEDLRKTEEGRKLLPAGIEELLQPIWEVKEAVK